MAEGRQLDSVSLGLKTAPKREELLALLDQVFEVGLRHLLNRYTKMEQKIAWSRIVVQGVGAANLCLRDFDLEMLKQKVEEIEKKLKVAQ